MKCILLFILSVVSLNASSGDLDVRVGKSSRVGDYFIAARYKILEIQYLDEGKQPDNIPNINRIINIGFNAPVIDKSRWQLNVLGGLSDSRNSYNGSGNGHHAKHGLDGVFAGFQVSRDITEHVGISLVAQRAAYQQSDIPQLETFNFCALAVKYTF